MRGRAPRSKLSVVIAASLIALVSIVTSAVARDVDPRQAGVDLLRLKEWSRAQAVFDSLLVKDLSDLGAGYMAAWAEAEQGRVERARCRFHEVEAAGGDDDVGVLSVLRRREFERTRADAQYQRWRQGSTEATGGPAGLVLLPLEPLGATTGGEFYGLAWSYLLYDYLKGSSVCPASMASTLLALDTVDGRDGVRLPRSVGAQPINTTVGLSGRLRLLPEAVGGSDITEPAQAIVFFQRNQGLYESGQADLATLRRLENVVREWMATPPPPLTPDGVPELLSRLGAKRALRGTYRIDESQVSIQMSLVDARGLPVHDRPIEFDFPLNRTSAAAARAASEIVAVGRGRLSPWSSRVPELGLGSWNAAARTRLLYDRGLGRIDSKTWDEMPTQVLDWPMLSLLHATQDRTGREQLEADWLQSWLRTPTLDPKASLLRLRQGLASPGFGARNATQAVGSRGRLIIRGVEQ